ncbi:probable sulfate transporter 3.3, partial [Phalaenopsis equestris]|uniref:probable sulfate transporter 3.3 n=1 Tax=Phalaenopsis equestris TaxID=78828 RepID=UPI0009E4F139
MCRKVERAPEEAGDIESSCFSITTAPEMQGLDEVVHKVPLPQNKKSVLKTLKHWSGECFFPDDPLHKVKNQKTATKKMYMVLQYLFPVLIWSSDYSLQLFKADVISGLTIASLAIPQGISYAKLANLPPIIGLYSSFVPPLIYVVLGSSRDLAVGSSSIVSVVLGSMLSEEVHPYEQPELYLKLALTTTFFAGALQALMGLLRLGFIVEFLSKPTLAGFTGGAAIITVLQQLKGLTGISHFTTKTGFLPVMQSTFEHMSEWNLKTMLMGFAFLAFLLLTRQIGMKRPKLYLISATGPLISVIISTIVIFAFRSEAHGIQTVGKLEEGLNPPSINKLLFKGSYVMLALKTGIITGILCLTEGIAVGRTFASLKDYQIDGNKEMMAIGIMNIVGSCSSCFATT